MIWAHGVENLEGVLFRVWGFRSVHCVGFVGRGISGSLWQALLGIWASEQGHCADLNNLNHPEAFTVASNLKP